MRGIFVALILVTLTSALPQRVGESCGEIEIPVTVSAKLYIVNTTLNDNWDAVSLTLNLTRQDAGKPSDPLPIDGQTPEPINSTYTVSATLCGNGGPTLVLTHGIMEPKLCVF
jgi:hypothetical protein